MNDNYNISIKSAQLRKKLGVDNNTPIDIVALLQSIQNLTTVFYPMGENLSGLCVKNKDNPIIAINSSMSKGRQRFSIAHELYHLYFDENHHIPVCSTSIGKGNKIELIADQFASYFLIPPISLLEAISKFKKMIIKS